MTGYSWGDLDLIVRDYRRPGAQINLTERQLIPDPVGSGPQSVLMGTGRWRRRREIGAWAEQADFDSLHDDYESQTTRLAGFPDGSSLTALIEKLDGRREPSMPGIFYSAVFVEV